MLGVLSVCLSVVLVGVFLIYYGRVAAFLIGLLFSFVNEHLDEPVEMLLVEVFALFAAAFCNTCIYSNPFLIFTVLIEMVISLSWEKWFY